MTDTPVSFERYISLTTKPEMDRDDIKSWLTTVRRLAPSGVVVLLQTTDDKGQPRSVAMVHREGETGHSYVIPLGRDLLDGEIQKIVDGFAAEHPDLDFDISTNQTALKPVEQKALSLDQEQHLALCMAMAKSKHEDWVRERTDAGWRYGTAFNEKERTHPLLRPWDQLPDRYRAPDLDWPQKLINMLNTQGYAVIRADELEKMLGLLRGVV